MTDTVLEEIFEELAHEEAICDRCGTPMASRAQWDAAGAVERRELVDDGIVAPGRRGVCRRCSDTMPRDEYFALSKIVKGQPQKVDTLRMVKEVDAHLKAGGSIGDIADRYQIKPSSIRRAISRARRRGDIS